MILKGKTALVTGAARRIGRVIALELAGRGANVAVHYNTSAADAEKTSAEISARGVKSMTVRADLARESEVAAMIGSVADKFGSLDVLVNSAAVFFKTPLDSVNEGDWSRTVDPNLKGTFFCSVHAGRRMITQPNGGAIVSIADVAALKPYLDYLPYSVSKAGVITMTKGLARAFAPKVRVNAVGLGPLLTPEDLPEKEVKEIVEKTPLKCCGSPADAASAVIFLLEGSDYITGVFLPVDGGRLIS